VADGKRAETAGSGAEGSFTGELAVVTGGGSGMGRELAIIAPCHTSRSRDQYPAGG
jgi:hypothetical protein